MDSLIRKETECKAAPKANREPSLNVQFLTLRNKIFLNDPPENVDNKNDKTLPVNASKPPQSVRNVPILRQSLSDSGVGKNMSSKQHSRSRNTSAQSNTEDKLQKVHEELEVNT